MRAAASFGLAAALAACVSPAALAEPGEVVWTGDAQAFGEVSGPLFAPWDGALPGDALEGAVEVRNDGPKAVEVFVRATGLEDGGERAAELAAAMPITVVSDDGTEVYSGTVGGASMDEPVSLGAVAPGATRSLSFASEVPAEVGNDLAMSSLEAGWEFTVQEEAADEPGEGPSSEPGGEPGTTPGGSGSEGPGGSGGSAGAKDENPLKNPMKGLDKTGDGTLAGALALAGVLGAASTAGAVALAGRGRKER